jgi:hypothetical protein
MIRAFSYSSKLGYSVIPVGGLFEFTVLKTPCCAQLIRQYVMEMYGPLPTDQKLEHSIVSYMKIPMLFT